MKKQKTVCTATLIFVCMFVLAATIFNAPQASAAAPVITSSIQAKAQYVLNATDTVVASFVSDQALDNVYLDAEVWPTGAATSTGAQLFATTSLSAGTTSTLTWNFTAPSTTGSYIFKLGVFPTTWTSAYYWNDLAATFTVVSSTALGSLTVSQGTLTPNFDPATLDYTVFLPTGSTTTPTINAVPADPRATITITQATALPGLGTVLVQDGTSTLTYSINFAFGRNVASVTPAANVSVAYGTASTSLGLPATLTATLNDGSTSTVPVTWDNGSPAYNPTLSGTYRFTGTLVPPAGIMNTNNVTASVEVTVQQQPFSGPIIRYITRVPATLGMLLAGTTTPSSTPALAIKFSADFGRGAKGTMVTELQRHLLAEGIYTGPVTGYFGRLTLGAVKAFQERHHISPANGYVGPKTRAVLNTGATQGSAKPSSLLVQLASLQEALLKLMQLIRR